MHPLLVMHQSIPAAPRLPLPPPPAHADPRALPIFFALDGKFPGGEDPQAVNSPGVGMKKKGKCSILHQHCNIFHWLHSQIVPF